MAMLELMPALDRFLEASTAAAKWRVVRPLERELQKDMRKAFRAQGTAFMEGFVDLQPLWESTSYREAITTADWLRVFDAAVAATFDLFLEPLEATAIAGLTLGSENVIADLDLSVVFDLANPRAVQYIQAHGAANVAGINDTTRGYLRTIITRAVEEGWSYARTAKAIKDRYREFAVGVPQQHIRSRAELVAVTESGMAYESGSNFVVADLEDAGIRMEKSWLTAKDKRVDPHCKANEDQGWIPFGDAFSDGSMHPLSHPACRCSALYRRAPS